MIRNFCLLMIFRHLIIYIGPLTMLKHHFIKKRIVVKLDIFRNFEKISFEQSFWGTTHQLCLLSNLQVKTKPRVLKSVRVCVIKTNTLTLSGNYRSKSAKTCTLTQDASRQKYVDSRPLTTTAHFACPLGRLLLRS